jgi:hypothetical protein
MRLLIALLLVTPMAFAQAPREIERASPCDKLAGAEQERCIAEEKARREQLGRSEAPKKACDELFGPEKELCLKKGGSVKTGTGATGSSR